MGNAIKKLLPSLDGSPYTIAFSVKIAPLSSPVCSTLNSNDCRSDVILWIPLTNSERTILSTSMTWREGVSDFRVVTSVSSVSSGASVAFSSMKRSVGGNIGNKSPSAGDSDVKKFGKLVSTNSSVLEFDVVTIGSADKDTNIEATSRKSWTNGNQIY